MRLRVAVLAAAFLAVVLAPGVAPAPVLAQTDAQAPEDFACQARSWIAGTSVLCDGVLTYRDYVYDDYGADRNTQGTSTGTLSYPAGDDRYPAGAQPNTADLVDLALRIRGDRLEVLAELNALYVPDSTVLALAIDTDADERTGGGQWGDLAVASKGWDVLTTFDRGDPASNLIAGSLRAPDGERWRIQAVAAINGGHVMNVAFRGPDELARYDLADIAAGRNVTTSEGAWFEDRQAEALAGGDVSAFGVTVDVADLRGGATRELDEVGPGLHERVYTSDVTLPPGEGMSYTGIPGRGTGGRLRSFNQQFHYFGRYQPYGLYLPDQPAPHGLQMVYHGSNQNHSQLVNLPGLQAQIGEARNRVLAAPLARGVHGYGSDISERDLLDVHADVLAHYDIDETKTYASGYSQGGYVTFRQSALYPDRFAGFASWVGFTGDFGNPAPPPAEDNATAGAVGNMIDFVGNYRHVAGALVYGDADELVHATSSNAMGNEFRVRDFPYVFYNHPTGDHFVFAAADDWEKETAYTEGFTVPARVPRVTYRSAEVLGHPDYGLRHDAAYWLAQIRGRETVESHWQAEEAYVDVDLTTFGCGGAVPVVAKTADAGPRPVPWVADSNAVQGTQQLPQRPALEGALRNVASLVVKAEEACLADAAVEYRVTTDGPSRVRFSDGRVLDLAEAGEHEGTLPAPVAPTAAQRAAGPDRVATAVAVSQAAFTGAEIAVVATAAHYPDALAGAPLAAALDAPLLLTDPGGLDERVAGEVRRLGAEHAIVLGGDTALAPAVADDLAGIGLAVERVSGPDRFATAAAVALALAEATSGEALARDVYLVEGADEDPARGWADAVSVSALAAQQRRPILLATSELVPPATMESLAALGTTRVTVVGGQAAIPDRTLATVADPDGDGSGQVALHRIHGRDRYATSAAVADRAMAAGATSQSVWLATGRDWPDALAAGAAAGAQNAPLLLVDGTSDDGGAAARAWLAAHQPVEQLRLVGGPGAVGAQAAAALR